jgi:hypothetical protein
LLSIDDRVRQPAEPTSGVRRHAIEAFAADAGNCCGHSRVL